MLLYEQPQDCPAAVVQSVILWAQPEPLAPPQPTPVWQVQLHIQPILGPGGPCGPVAPVAPVAPVGPVGPGGPAGPVGPVNSAVVWVVPSGKVSPWPEPAIVSVWSNFAVPFTSSVAVGVVVPMPTLPPAFKKSLPSAQHVSAKFKPL